MDQIIPMTLERRNYRNKSSESRLPLCKPSSRERPMRVKKKRKILPTSYPCNFFQSWDSEIHLALVTKWTLPYWWGLINRLALSGILHRVHALCEITLVYIQLKPTGWSKHHEWLLFLNTLKSLEPQSILMFYCTTGTLQKYLLE